MTFTVTYRGADGALCEKRVEAANRGECFAQCRARGIAPLGVKEGAPKGARKPTGRTGASPVHGGFRKGQGARSSGRRIVVFAIGAAFVALIIGGMTWWWLVAREDTRTPESVPPRKTALPKEVKPAAAPKPAIEEPITNAAPGMAEKKPASWRDPKLSEEGRLAAYAKTLEDSPLPDTSSNRLFRSGIEQMMGWMFTTEVGDMPPPLPRIPDFDLVHLQEILDSKCEIGASDSERQAETKGIVDFAKAELKKYLEKGGSPDAFLKYYHDQLKTAHQHRQIVQDQVMKVLQEEPERAEEFLKEANKGLAEMGIKAVVIPERIRRRLGLTNDNVSK